ncbi:ABC transporter permease [Lapillicoccus sp.]|uniref:ABC transporter permease n=1 Tax=Lapillicoccus sp. TaxID=1909287 RepID=UPI003267EF80
MGAVLARRLLRVIPQMLVLVTIAFALVHLTPGSTGTVNVQTGMSQNLEQLRGDLGLDRPLNVQYLDWLGRVVRLDFGMSYVDGRPVLGKILERLPATLLLTATALVLSTVLGILLGIVSALRQNTKVDYAATVFAFFGLSIPSFWAGLLMILLFSVTLRLLPAQGMESIGGGGPLDVLKHLIMPACVLALEATAAMSRYVRSSMSEVLHEDYIRTARAKGLPERVIIGRHALRNALLPAVTILGLRLPVLVGGALLIETVFAWPGIGRLGYESVTQRDYPVILGLLIFTGLLTILGNLLADVTYAIVDPRVKVEG